MAELKQFCTFYVDQRLFGVEVYQVQEVIQSHQITEVPLADPVIRGLMNLRGSIVSSIDLRRRFAIEARENGADSANVVTQTGTGLVSFEVDRIGEVVEVTEDCFEATPGALGGEMRRMIAGVYKLEGELLLVLDVDRVVDIDGIAA